MKKLEKITLNQLLRLRHENIENYKYYNHELNNMQLDDEEFATIDYQRRETWKSIVELNHIIRCRFCNLLHKR